MGALAGVLLAILALPAGTLLWWWRRPNRARIHPMLADVLEHWDVVADGQHNSNTDMIEWRGDLLLVHAASPYHLGTPRCRLVVRRSRDGRRWEELAALRAEGRDIRDPKLLAVGGRLLLYALTNDSIMATPNRSVVATSDDAVHWSDWQPVGPEGWLFWRPKSNDGGRTWYVPVYWHEHGASKLLRSHDGLAWEEISTVHEGEANDETAIEFLPDGRVLATCRLEVTPDNVWGHAEAGTMLCVAPPPFADWTKTKSRVTRLDGPVLFPWQGRVFAVARYQPGRRGRFTRLGGAFSRKRTALFEITADRILYLSDLPSAGDTSYAGVVIRDGTLHADYYTSDIRRDPAWLLGMFLRSDIRMARLPMARLVELADAIGP